jgi:Membrane-bound toxin component of toxin-antitoxin system
LSGERILRVNLSPSRGLAATIVAVHAGAGACSGLLLSGVAGICLAILLTGLGLAAAWDRALLRGTRSMRVLQVADDDNLTLELANADVISIRVARRRYVGKLGVILPAAVSMRRTIVVARDMLDPEAFRALRLWALWGRLPGSAARHPGSYDSGTERTIS